MQGLSEGENALLGSCAAFVEAVTLQPTIYWKNARMQRLPFTLDPRVSPLFFLRHSFRRFRVVHFCSLVSFLFICLNFERRMMISLCAFLSQLVYRGMGAALCNEMGQMGIQFGLTGYVKRVIAGPDAEKLSPTQEVQSAFAGGAVAAVFAAPVELVMIQQQRHGGSLLSVPVNVVKEKGIPFGLFRGFWPTFFRDGIYVGFLLGVTPVIQDHLIERGWGTAAAGLNASLVSGMVAGLASCPFDVVKTCMAGDLKGEKYGNIRATFHRLWFKEGGLKRLFAGAVWRTINITGTVYLANECRVRLAPILFPHATFYHTTVNEDGQS